MAFKVIPIMHDRPVDAIERLKELYGLEVCAGKKGTILLGPDKKVIDKNAVRLMFRAITPYLPYDYYLDDPEDYPDEPNERIVKFQNRLYKMYEIVGDTMKALNGFKRFGMSEKDPTTVIHDLSAHLSRIFLME